jgi:hypothetical protein
VKGNGLPLMDFNEFCRIDLPFQMTQEQIKAARKKLDEKHQLLREAQEELRLKGKMLIRRCKHPNVYQKGHYDGSTSSNCPDCGMSN